MGEVPAEAVELPDGEHIALSTGRAGSLSRPGPVVPDTGREIGVLDTAAVATRNPRTERIADFATAAELRAGLEANREREGGGRLWAVDRGRDRDRRTVLTVADIAYWED